MGWHFITSSPEPKPIEKTKDEVNNKKLIFILQLGTIADSELQLIVIPSTSLLPNLM